MPKYDNPTPPRPDPGKHLDQDGQALVAALTAAILAARDDAPAVPHRCDLVCAVERARAESERIARQHPPRFQGLREF